MLICVLYHWKFLQICTCYDRDVNDNGCGNLCFVLLEVLTDVRVMTEMLMITDVVICVLYHWKFLQMYVL